MDKKERGLLAKQYHMSGLNCAQSILASFSDVTGLTEKQSFALCSGFGGGMHCGGICGTVSGAITVLGMLYPHLPENGAAGKQRATAMTKEMEQRFTKRFTHLNCRELLADHDLHGTALADELDVKDHCGMLIVSAVEMLYDYLDELKEE